LTGALGYRIPQVIRAVVADHSPFPALIDIGCGTGLVGAALADRVAAMDGIDIAPRMTRKALERGIYRHLRTGDAAAILRSDPALSGPYDLAVAADVFVYLGALESIFAAVGDVLTPDGLFVFSAETAEGTAPVLRSSGRFGHPYDYVSHLADRFGFVIAAQHSHPIRNERDNPIPGVLYLLERR
ncbi:MAG: methyltransferase, partial [Alphaproteobacteria bacterium]|nr:methyltransferase [Alphaproteobacteria bacterium]